MPPQASSHVPTYQDEERCHELTAERALVPLHHMEALLHQSRYVAPEASVVLVRTDERSTYMVPGPSTNSRGWKQNPNTRHAPGAPAASDSPRVRAALDIRVAIRLKMHIDRQQQVMSMYPLGQPRDSARTGTASLHSLLTIARVLVLLFVGDLQEHFLQRRHRQAVVGQAHLLLSGLQVLREDSEGGEERSKGGSVR